MDGDDQSIKYLHLKPDQSVCISFEKLALSE